MGWGNVESSWFSRAIALAVFLLAGCTEPVPVVRHAKPTIVDRAAQDSTHEEPKVVLARPARLETGDPLPFLALKEAFVQPKKEPERQTEPDEPVTRPPDSPTSGDVKPTFTVRLTPATIKLPVREKLSIQAELLDSQGRVLQNRGAIWWSSDRRIATVSEAGEVTAVAAGVATISASLGGVQGDAAIEVDRVPVDQVEIRIPTGSELVVGTQVQLSTVVREASGQVLLDRGNPTWTSDRPAIVSVDAGGRITANAPGTAQIRAVVDGVSSTVTVHSVLRFTQIAAGSQHTCAIATTGDTWCWGTGLRGELGIGIATSAPIPAKVLGGYSFRWLTARESHTCGLTMQNDGAGNAICWGRGSDGRLGTGRTSNEWTPSRVVGNRTFDVISAGTTSTCGLSGGVGFCWGAETGTSSPDPVPALQGFEDVLVGAGQAAGIQSGELFHFPGLNTAQAMSGSSPDPVPARVLIPALDGKGTILSYALGKKHACASLVPTTGQGSTWCWGEGPSGQLGNGAGPVPKGSAVQVDIPVGLTGLVAGNAHSCGLTSSGIAWCWGDNSHGQLGFSSDVSMSDVPVQVVGPQFSTLAAGADHTCGISISGEVWCWGKNASSQLGDGTTTSVNHPVLVSSQH